MASSNLFSFADHGDVKRSLLTVGAVGAIMWLTSEGEKKKSPPSAAQPVAEVPFPVKLSKSGFSLKTQQILMTMNASDSERWYDLGKLIKAQGKWSTNARNENKTKEERLKRFLTVASITVFASWVFLPRERRLHLGDELCLASVVTGVSLLWLRIWSGKRNVYNSAANRWKALETSFVQTLELESGRTEEKLEQVRREAAEIFNQQNSDWDATRK